GKGGSGYGCWLVSWRGGVVGGGFRLRPARELAAAGLNATRSVDVVVPASSGVASPKGESVEAVDAGEGVGNSSGGGGVVSGGSDKTAPLSGGVEPGAAGSGSGSVKRTTSGSDGTSSAEERRWERLSWQPGHSPPAPAMY